MSNTSKQKNDKGRVLTSFLKYLTFTPKRIIFVDDVKDNLVDVEESLKETEIAYSGWHFTGAEGGFSGDVSAERFVEAWDKLMEDALSTIERFHLLELQDRAGYVHY